MQLLTPVAPTGPGPREFGLLKEAKRLTGVIRRGWRALGISILVCLLAAITYLAVAGGSITSATNILTWLADGGLAFACASGLWSGVDKPEAQAKVFLFAPEARLGLRKNSLRVRTLVAEVIPG